MIGESSDVGDDGAEIDDVDESGGDDRDDVGDNGKIDGGDGG